MNTETKHQLNTIRQILESLEAGWLQLFINAESSDKLHGRILTVLTRDVHTQLSQAHAIAQTLHSYQTDWPDTAEGLLTVDTAKLSGLPDELFRSTLSRIKGVSALVADACERQQEDQHCSLADIDNAIWDIQGRVSELLHLLEPLTDLPSELRRVA